MRTSISTSVRRHFVDKFFIDHAELCRNKKVIDLGGKKRNKRGLFNINSVTDRVTYINIDTTTEPDIVSDIAQVPLPDKSYDIVILGETLEHVPDPVAVLKEGGRLLREGGMMLITVPFNYPVHADPYDFGRYTDYFWQKTAKDLGFKINLERHGTMFAVLALMVQHLFQSKNVSWRPIQIPIIKLLMWLDSRTKNKLLQSWTTGYGIVLVKEL